MNVSFQYANRNNTSVLLKFDGVIDNQTVCLLVDAGEGVDVDNLINEDQNEYLTGVLLTHLHLDHYTTLDKNLRDGAKIYTSDENKKLLNTVLTEASSNRDNTFNTRKIRSSVEPISDSVTIGGELTITPVPVGHAPGATGFYIEFEGDDGTETILVTGDFTRREVAGYSGLSLHDTDTLILTGATCDDFRESITSAVSKTIEQGVSGSPTLVTASGLNSVHFAYLLGHTIKQASQPLQVNIVGQAAKLYDALDYTVPNVNSIQEYDAEDVVDEGCITISGPDTPNCGGSELLFDEIRSDPNAGLIQLVSSNRGEIAESRCTVNQYMIVNHPTMETIDETIELLDPKQVIVTHQTGSDLERYRDQFSTVVWAPKSNKTFTFYKNGEQKSPYWVSDSVIKNFKSNDQAIELPSVTASANNFERTEPNLAEEGLNIDELALLAERDNSEYKYSTSTTTPEVEKSEEPSTADTSCNPSGELMTDGAAKSPQGNIGSNQSSPSKDQGESEYTLSELKTQLDKIEEAVVSEDGVAATTVHVDNETLVLKINDNSDLPDVGESVIIQ